MVIFMPTHVCVHGEGESVHQQLAFSCGCATATRLLCFNPFAFVTAQTGRQPSDR